MKKRILALVLSVAMALSALPFSVFAEGETAETNRYAAGDGASYLFDVPNAESLAASSHTTTQNTTLPIRQENGENFIVYDGPYQVDETTGERILDTINDSSHNATAGFGSTIHAAQITYGGDESYAGAGVPAEVPIGTDARATYMAVRIKINDNSPAFSDFASTFRLSLVKADGSTIAFHENKSYPVRWFDLNDGSMVYFFPSSHYSADNTGRGYEFSGDMDGYLMIPFTAPSTGTTTSMITADDFRNNFRGLKVEFLNNNTISGYMKASSWEDKEFLLGDCLLVNDLEAFATSRSEKRGVTDKMYSPKLEDTAYYASRVSGFRTFFRSGIGSFVSKHFYNPNTYGTTGNYTIAHITTLPNGDRAFELVANTSVATTGTAYLQASEAYDKTKQSASNGNLTSSDSPMNGSVGTPNEIDTTKINAFAFRIATKDGTVENEAVTFSLVVRTNSRTTTSTTPDTLSTYALTAGEYTYINVNTRETETLTANSSGNISYTGNLDGYILIPYGKFKSGSTALTQAKIQVAWGGANNYVRGAMGYKMVSGFANGKALYAGDVFFVQNTAEFVSYHTGSCANGHTVVVDAAVAPTCDEVGLTEGSHCSVCNKVIVEQNEIAALGHTNTSVVIPSTNISAGYTEYTCSVCGKVSRDTYTDSLGGPNGKLGLGMFRFTGDVNNYLTDGVNTAADKLAEIEDVLAQGYVNTMFIEVDSLFEEKVALCREYGCTFWIGPGTFKSEYQTIETYMANIELKVNKIIEVGAWDLFQGFDWDEPIWNGMSNEDFLTMTKALYEKWGKRIFPIFAVGSFIDGYGEGYTTIAPEYMEYVTDAGWDLYTYDVRDSALTNTSQNNAIASVNEKYGINCANAQEYYRWIHSEMMEKMSHNVNVWFFPAAYTRTALTGETIDEGYWLGHLNFFNQLLQEQTKPGGLIVYNYSGTTSAPALEQRLPVPNITTGEQIMFTDVEKYTTYAARLRELKTQYDNTPITIAKYVPSGTLNLTKVSSDYINFLPVAGFEYSINGGTSWQTTGSFTNLTPETDYTICVKETQNGAVKNFAVSTLAVNPYASGLNDTASYAMKMPTNLSIFSSHYGSVGTGMGRTKDDTAFAASGASKYLHLKTIDGERFIELQNNNGDANSSINLAFGDKGRPTSATGISEGIDTTNLTAFAFRVKTTGGTDDQLSIFDFYINGHRTTRTASYPVKYIDKATGNVSNMTYQSGLNITGNIDGWIVIPFASYQGIDGITAANNKQWIIDNLKTIQPWMHEEDCGNHNASASSWDNGKKLYFGDVMYVENIDTFISVHGTPAA